VCDIAVSDVIVKLAWPVASREIGALSKVPPSRNEIVPSVTATPPDDTVAVKVTDWPKTDGLPDVMTVVDVSAGAVMLSPDIDSIESGGERPLVVSCAGSGPVMSATTGSVPESSAEDEIVIDSGPVRSAPVPPATSVAAVPDTVSSSELPVTAMSSGATAVNCGCSSVDDDESVGPGTGAVVSGGVNVSPLEAGMSTGAGASVTAGGAGWSGLVAGESGPDTLSSGPLETVESERKRRPWRSFPEDVDHPATGSPTVASS